MKLYLIFDGGNHASKDKEAYGSFIYHAYSKDGPVLQRARITHGIGYTNNEAEYLTLIAALNYIIELYDAVSDIHLMIEGDSELIRNQIGIYTKTLCGDNSWTGWKVNVTHLLPLRNKARELFEKFASFRYNHISREEVITVLGH